jgi:hypothetical protein
LDCGTPVPLWFSVPALENESGAGAPQSKDASHQNFEIPQS